MPKIRIIAQPEMRLRIVSKPVGMLKMYAHRGENGLSTYDIAVRNGFVGTEAEWIASFLTVDALTDHVNDPTPHPAYDDISSLQLLFENGLI